MNSKWPFHLSPIEINEVLNYVEEGYGERTIARELGLRRTQVDKAIRAFKDGTLSRENDKIVYNNEAFEISNSIQISKRDISLLEKLTKQVEAQVGPKLFESALVPVDEQSRSKVQTVHRASSQEDIASLWEAASKVNEKIIERHLSMPFFDTIIDDPGPIAISFISDHHIAPYAPCDLKKMAEDAALIAATPGAYAILGGDGVDNHIKHQTAVMLQESTPDIQWQLYDHYLNLLNVDDSILVMISGNHDDWTIDFAGIDMVSVLSRKHKLHYAPDEAYINLKLGNQKYVIGMRHKYRFNSSSNLGHTVKKWYDEGKIPFDIGCIGHHHDAHYEIFYKHSQERIAFRPGSYQISSTFARRNGFNPSRPVAPTVVLWGDRREMMAFKDVKQGVEYLTYLRQKAGL